MRRRIELHGGPRQRLDRSSAADYREQKADIRPQRHLPYPSSTAQPIRIVRHGVVKRASATDRDDRPSTMSPAASVAARGPAAASGRSCQARRHAERLWAFLKNPGCCARLCVSSESSTIDVRMSRADQFAPRSADSMTFGVYHAEAPGPDAALTHWIKNSRPVPSTAA